MRVDTEGIEMRAKLRFEREVPTMLDWNEKIWQVIDRPTQITREIDLLHPLITHPPERDVRISGWRFIARPANGGNALVFDLFESITGWQVCCVRD